MKEFKVIVRGSRYHWQALMPELDEWIVTSGEISIPNALRKLADNIELWAVTEAVESRLPNDIGEV